MAVETIYTSNDDDTQDVGVTNWERVSDLCARRVALAYFQRSERERACLGQTRRTIIFGCDSLDIAVDRMKKYASSWTDEKSAISGMPRSALPWRDPGMEKTDASCLLAAFRIFSGTDTDAAEALAECMCVDGVDNLHKALCLAEDLHIISENFLARFGDERL